MPLDLEAPDKHHLNAARGWIELGNNLKADAELAKITPQGRKHPHVLEAYWLICSIERRWDVGLDVAETMVEVAPDLPEAWINRSVALHELKRTREAEEHLTVAADKFPSVWLIRHNLACYAIALGKPYDAREWLRDALKLDPDKAKVAALDDPDLVPLLREIGEV